MLRAGLCLIACVSLVAAQDHVQAPDKDQASDKDKDKVSVPLSSPSQPATIKIHLVSGSITVTGGTGTEVVVESNGGFREGRGADEVPAGMHRLDTGRSSGFDITEDHNVVTIGTGPSGGAGNLSIQVPVNSSLTLKALNGGHVDVTGVNGELDIENMNGPITLKSVSGSVTAHALNGGITVTLDKVTADKPMSFTCMNGPIDVTLPADTRARLRMKTDHGSVYSDFEVKTDPAGKGDKTVIGSLNGGGPEFRFETVTGNILLHKK